MHVGNMNLFKMWTKIYINHKLIRLQRERESADWNF